MSLLIFALAAAAELATVDRLPPVGLVRSLGIGQKVANGVLISPCHLLTVRHFTKAKDPVGSRILFTARDRSRSKGTVVASGTGPNPRDHTDWSDDWALIRLDRCLGDVLGHLPIGADALLPAVSAAAMVNHTGALYHQDCKAVKLTRGSLEVDCYIQQGFSGGPIVIRDPVTGTQRLIGLMAGMWVDGSKRPNFATPLLGRDGALPAKLRATIAAQD